MILLALLSLTVAPNPFLAIEATCSGGIAGRTRKVRLTSDGRLTRSEGYTKPMAYAGRITPAQAKALSLRLDRASFDTLPSLPRARTVYDGVSCTLKREGKTWHAVQFAAGAASPPKAVAGRYREARAVLSEILGAANHEQVKLNPQPIPPVDR